MTTSTATPPATGSRGTLLRVFRIVALVGAGLTAIQFALAGLGAFGTLHKDHGVFAPHESLGMVIAVYSVLVLVLALIAGGAVAAVVIILVIIDRWAGNKRTLDHDVASTIFNMVSVLYAVLLAFVVVEVWQADSNAQSYSQEEASDVSQLYFTARALP